MKLFLSFTGLSRFWKQGEVDFSKDLFFFGCGPRHVFEEPGADTDAVPWLEWIKWGGVSKEDCLKVRALLKVAKSEGRLDFAKHGRCHGPIAAMLRRNGIEPPPEPEEEVTYSHSYPEVRDWLKGIIECPF